MGGSAARGVCRNPWCAGAYHTPRARPVGLVPYQTPCALLQGHGGLGQGVLTERRCIPQPPGAGRAPVDPAGRLAGQRQQLIDHQQLRRVTEGKSASAARAHQHGTALTQALQQQVARLLDCCQYGRPCPARRSCGARQWRAVHGAWWSAPWCALPGAARHRPRAPPRPGCAQLEGSGAIRRHVQCRQRIVEGLLHPRDACILHATTAP